MRRVIRRGSFNEFCIDFDGTWFVTFILCRFHQPLFTWKESAPNFLQLVDTLFGGIGELLVELIEQRSGFISDDIAAAIVVDSCLLHFLAGIEAGQLVRECL